VRKALQLGLLNSASYFLLTFDIRSVSQANIPYVIAVNLTIAMLSFTIFKRLQEAKTLADRIAFAVFGTAGTVVGI
jgi:hypothetical protein